LLALKSLDAIRQLVDRAGGRERLPLRFAYACAIDDPGDAGKPLLEALELVEPMDEKQWDPQKARIVDWMKKLGERAEYADLFAPADPIIRLDHYKPFDIARRPYSTHRLIDHVHEALDHVDAPAPSP
jgi:hypothetical protein